MKKKIKVAFKQYTNTLQEEYNTLINSLDNPELILTKLFNPDKHQSYYNHITHAIRDEGVGNHELQDYLIHKVKEYLSEFDNEVIIEPWNRYQYPTHIKVVYRNYTILSFSIYSHKFTNELPKIKIKYLREEIQRDTEWKQELESELNKWESYSKNKLNLLNPIDYDYKGFKLLITLIRDAFLLAWKWKLVNKGINRMMEERKKRINNLVNTIEENKKKLNELEKIMPALETKYEQWKTIMAKFGYKENVK